MGENPATRKVVKHALFFSRSFLALQGGRGVPDLEMARKSEEHLGPRHFLAWIDHFEVSPVDFEVFNHFQLGLKFPLRTLG
jgi:hypothetical protein